MFSNKKLKNIKTKSLKSQNVKSPGRNKQAAAEWRAHDEARKIMSNKVTPPILKEILAHANISTILKEPGDAFQESVEDDFFNPPLHSTAVYNDDDDDVLQTNEMPDRIPAKLMSPITSVVPEKSLRQVELKQSPAASKDPSAQRPDTAKPKESLQKKAQKIPEPSPLKTTATARTQATEEPSSTLGPNNTPNRKVIPQAKTQKVSEPLKKQAPARTLPIGEPSSAPGPSTAPNRTAGLQKKTQEIPEPGPSKTSGTVRSQATGKPSSTQGPNTTPKKKVIPQAKTQKVPEPLKKPAPARTLPIGEPSSAPGPSTAPNRTANLQKKTPKIPEPGPSKTSGTARNRATREPFSALGPHTSQNSNVVSAKNAKGQRKEEATSSKKKSTRDNADIAPADTSGPEIVAKSVKSGNELDFLLLECGKVIESYRDETETDDCRKVIDAFSHSFKEQLSTTISELQKLKDLKRKNTKMQNEIGMKRKRLLQVKSEIIVKQPKLNQLQVECSELEQKQKSLKSARDILDNLTHFQNDYRKFKAENPHVKETYGTCSLPALCLETGNIMKAEQHFHIVNRKLQSVIDKEKGD